MKNGSPDDEPLGMKGMCLHEANGYGQQRTATRCRIGGRATTDGGGGIRKNACGSFSDKDCRTASCTRSSGSRSQQSPSVHATTLPVHANARERRGQPCRTRTDSPIGAQVRGCDGPKRTMPGVPVAAAAWVAQESLPITSRAGSTIRPTSLTVPVSGVMVMTSWPCSISQVESSWKAGQTFAVSLDPGARTMVSV
jgi:hypothetical protein